MRHWVDEVEPHSESFEQPQEWYDEQLYAGRWVTWKGQPGVMMKIDADMVVATPDNPFDWGHLAFIKRAIETSRDNVLLEAPAGRIHVVDAAHVAESQQIYEDGHIEEMGMTRPWDEDDIGRHYFFPLDGNHRAFAAIYAGEPYIWVYVGENYREDVSEHLAGLW